MLTAVIRPVARPLLVARVVSPSLLLAPADPVSATTSLLAFADQADNLAGPLFASSLFPYLAFLYFLRYENNGLSPTAKNGFTSLLVFVFATVVCSIVGVKTFGLNLANVDWLHSEAEQLLTLTNVIEVVGLKLTLDAFIQGDGAEPKAPLVPLVPACAAVAVATCAYTYAAAGGTLSEHTAYLGGIGNLCAATHRRTPPHATRLHTPHATRHTPHATRHTPHAKPH